MIINKIKYGKLVISSLLFLSLIAVFSFEIKNRNNVSEMSIFAAIFGSSSDSDDYTLKVKKTGYGTVKSETNDIYSKKINCGSRCKTEYSADTEVTLVAYPSNDSFFVGWSGNSCSKHGKVNRICVVKMNDAKIISADFKRGKADDTETALLVTKTGNGSGKVKGKEISCGTDCIGKYHDGDKIILTAKTDKGSLFSGWGGDCSGSDKTCEISMGSQTKTVSANFHAKPQTLKIEKTTGGTIKSEDGAIDCGSTCSADYEYGTKVVLNATADDGYSFGSKNWKGCSSVSGDKCIVKMKSAKRVRAKFTQEDSNTASDYPDAPSDLSTETGACDSGSVTVKWTDNSDNESNFYIWRYDSDKTYQKYFSVDANTSSYTDTTVGNESVSYYYFVQACTSNSAYCKSSANWLKATAPSACSDNNTTSSVDVKVREVLMAREYGDWADSVTLNNANSNGVESIDIKWTTNNISSCVLSLSSNGQLIKGFGYANNKTDEFRPSSYTDSYNSQDYTVNTSDRQTATYTLSCTDQDGESISDSADVTF